MEIPGFIREPASVLFLLVILGLSLGEFLRGKFVKWFKASNFLFLLMPLALFGVQIFVLDETERTAGRYVLLAAYFAVPALWVLSKKEKTRFAESLGLLAWLWFFIEAGVIRKNYVNVLSAAIYTLLTFSYLGKPELGCGWSFRKVSWKMLLAAILIFSSFVYMAWGIKLEFFHWAPTKLLSEYQFALPLVAIFFFFAKAVPEELVFRAVLQNTLAVKWSAPVAVGLSSLVYGLAAIGRPVWDFPNWHAVATASVIGLICGYVYHRSKSLLTSVLLNFAASFSLWLIFKEGVL